MINEKSYAQVTTPNNNDFVLGDYVGWDGSMGIPLDIRTTNANNIDFFTGGVLRMNLIGNAFYNDGYLGIDLTTPRFRLDVNNNIGLQPKAFDEAYYIDSVPVVRVWPLDPGGIDYPNIFVGARAGLNINNVGNNLTFVGSVAGVSNTSGSFNTFIGNSAGTNNTTGASNSFVGATAGRDNTTGDFNAFFGTLSGQNNTTGSQNIAIGNRAYSTADTEVDNTSIGFNSAIILATGDSNVFVGSRSALSQTIGSNNVSLGANAGSTFASGNALTLVGANTIADNNLTNAGAFGQGVWVRNSNDLLLGDNNTNVGIGLSGVAAGATAPLEINTAGANLSGLRFTDLNSLSPASVSNITRVLTLNLAGDVIFGDIPIGTGPITACTSPGLTTNYITKATASTQICRSQIYDDGTSVGIGVGASPNTAMKLHIKGDYYIEGTPPNGGDLFMNDATGNIQRVLSMYGLGGRGSLSIGHYAGNSDAYGVSGSSLSASVYVGYEAGRNIANSVSHNTFVGYRSGFSLNSALGNSNSFMGSNAALNMVEGRFNVVIGSNSAVGQTTDLFTSGEANIFIGADVQNNKLINANNNIVMGQYAAVINDNSSTIAANNNIVIGRGTVAHDLMTLNGPDEIQQSAVIGTGAQVWCDSCFVLGNRTVHRVGIGTYQPASTTILDVDPRTGMAWAAIFRDTAIQVNAVHVASDMMLKEQVQPISGVSDLLGNLGVYNYKYKKQDFPQVGIDGGFHFGLMAQEVEQEFPLLVKSNTADAMYDSTGQEIAPALDYKSINILEFIPLLIQGFKEQKTNLDNLQQQVNDLTIQLNNCCNNPQPSINNGENPVIKSSVALSNKETIILNQNAPNPFKDRTEITYTLPESVQDAVIMFYDHSGKVIQKFEISHRGAGSLTVYGEDLTSGVYTYSLIIDGENHQTKRMVKK